MSSASDPEAVPAAYTWDLSSLFHDDDEWRSTYETAEGAIDELRNHEGTITESGDALLAALSCYEDVMRQVSDVHTYARLRRDEDTRDSDAQAMATRAASLAADAGSAASFIQPAIQSFERETVEAMLEAEPDLREYEHFLDDVLRMKPHTRSPEIEELLADLSDVTDAPGEVYSMLSNADMTFPGVEDPEGEERELTLNSFVTLQKHPDRDFRQRVYEAFYDEWDEHRNTVAAAYRKAVTANRKLAAARNYESARESALDGPNVPESVYDALVETVRDNLDVLHRHAELKRSKTDGDDLRMWDLYVPLVAGESPDVPYEEARNYVTESVAPLGAAYQERLREGLDSRWIDVYESPGKRSGAYSSGTYDSQPYILMNYQDDVDSMYTLAHELGHSLHSALSSEHQPYVYYSYEFFVAEIASTVNERLLTHHLLETISDEQLRRHVLNQALEGFRGTLFRQTMFAEFEHRAHEQAAAGQPVTADSLDQLYADLKGAYYEPGIIDDRIRGEWMRIPHFYRGYYVYQYATGISAAVAIAEEILDEGEAAADRYRELLEAGSSDYPMALLDEAGVDMRSQEPVEAAIDVYDDYLDEFEQLQ